VSPLGESAIAITGGAAAIGVGLVFVTAGLAKLRSRRMFPGVVANYRLLPETMVAPVAYALPWAELAIGLGLMAGIDKGTELVGAAETGRGREIPRGLIAPGFIQRMLGDGEQFDMREAEIDHVGDQRLSQLVPGVEAAVG
jgi:hypothetical protein